jgi:signal transduction histidine kinase
VRRFAGLHGRGARCVILAASAGDRHVGIGAGAGVQAKRFAEQSVLKIHLDMTARIDRLDADREIALFQVFQECVLNVRWHANTDSAHARLRAVEQASSSRSMAESSSTISCRS